VYPVGDKLIIDGKDLADIIAGKNAKGKTNNLFQKLPLNAIAYFKVI
jgi:hypothetical protein